MKSVEKYPEYQGDPDNIQFLTKDEHLDAHQGNWQNPTNWYYDPATKQITDFGEGKYVPCPVIELSHPIISITLNTQKKTPTEEKTEKPKTNSPTLEQSNATKNASQPKTSSVKTKNAKEKNVKFKKAKGSLELLGTKIKSGSKNAGRFLVKHWKKIAAVGLAIGATVAEEKLRKSGSSSDSDSFNDNDGYSSPDYLVPDNDDISDYDDALEENDMTDDEISRSPMSPHRRRGHPHKYNTKNGIIIHMLNDIGVNGFDLENDDSDEDDN